MPPDRAYVAKYVWLNVKTSCSDQQSNFFEQSLDASKYPEKLGFEFDEKH